MILSIQDGDLTVSVKVCDPEEGMTLSECMLIAALKACECFASSDETIRAYYHVDPDIRDLRDEEDELWSLFRKYGIAFHFHIKENQADQTPSHSMNK